MTALAILIAVIASAAYSTSTGTTYFAFGMTVYVAIFIAGLATASMAALVSRDRRAIIAALILIANFCIAQYAWTTADPTLVGTILDLATAAIFLMWGNTRWQLAIGFVLLTSVLFGVLTWLGIIPDAAHRPDGFIVASYPDLSAIAGNTASILLGLGAGDSGYRVREMFRARPRLVLARERVLRVVRSGLQR